jgi:hypothetical protein
MAGTINQDRHLVSARVAVGLDLTEPGCVIELDHTVSDVEQTADV